MDKCDGFCFVAMGDGSRGSIDNTKKKRLIPEAGWCQITLDNDRFKLTFCKINFNSD